VPLTAVESDLLRVYLEKGGSVVLLQDPLIASQAPVTSTEPFVNYLAQSWGVKLDNDVIVDLYNSISGQPLYPTDSSYGTSTIVSRLQKIKTVFPVARSVSVPAAGQELTGTTYSVLVKVDPAAWGETNFGEFNQASGPTQDPTDIQPPLNVAVTAQNSTSKARLVVFGNSNFAINAFYAQGANANLLVNTIDWATADETLINVTPRTPTQLTLSLTNSLTINAIFVLVVILMPLLVLVMGGVVWFQRRRHA
jgi:gliding motility-associatede transport system auxiliary component